MIAKFMTVLAVAAIVNAGVVDYAPAPVAYHAAPAPVAYHAAPAPLAYHTAPAPVAYHAASAPLAYHAASAPLAYHAAPSPVAYHAAPIAKVAAPLAYAAPVAKIAAPLAYAAPVAKAVVAEEYDPHPQYSYAYDIQDGLTGDSKSQHETREGDVVRGSYSLIDADGTKRTVEYVADPHNGFNAVVHREPLHHAAPVVKTVAAGPVAYAAAPIAKIATPLAYHH